MSLPLNSPQANSDDLDPIESALNGRKMDFALCKYSHVLKLFFIYLSRSGKTFD